MRVETAVASRHGSQWTIVKIQEVLATTVVVEQHRSKWVYEGIVRIDLVG